MSSTVTIEELTGKKRKIELRGPGQPLRPAAWEGEQTVATQWYPGNEDATQHVLGPKELPSDWNGVWKTTQMLRCPSLWTPQPGQTPQQVGFAYALNDIFESLRADGQLLRVIWANESLAPTGASQNAIPQRSYKKVRIGRLTAYKGSFDRLDDLAWNATFTWTGRGDRQVQVQTVSKDLTAAIQSAINSCDGVTAKQNTGLRAPPTRFSLGSLEALVKAPLATVDSFARFANSITGRLQDLGNIILQVRDTPAAILGRGIDVANNAVAVANQFQDAISRQGPETLALSNRLSMMTATLSYYNGAMTEAQVMADANAGFSRMAAQRRASVEPGGVGSGEMQDVYIPRDGDTMTTIALRFYQADVSAELSRANGLPGYTIKPPRIPLVIPTRAVLDSLSVQSV